MTAPPSSASRKCLIEPGERVLVAGESGTGKARWCARSPGSGRWGGGSVDFQPDRRMFLLPQKPYVPSGTLRRAVAYPGAAEDWRRAASSEVLDKVGLAHLKEKIED